MRRMRAYEAKFTPAGNLWGKRGTYPRGHYYLVTGFVEREGDLQAYACIAAGNQYVTFVTRLVLVGGIPRLSHQVGQQGRNYRAQSQYL